MRTTSNRYSFHAEQWVPYPVESVFEFFADPNNLPGLMPAWQKPHIERATYVAPPQPGGGPAQRLAAGTGSQFTITFRPVPFSPIRLSWQAYIAEFEWNDHFCDEQRRGPFGYWRHWHRVAPERRGTVEGTTVIDDLQYELPFRTLSGLANSIVASRQIRSIFKYRQQVLPVRLRRAFPGPA